MPWCIVCSSLLPSSLPLAPPCCCRCRRSAYHVLCLAHPLCCKRLLHTHRASRFLLHMPLPMQEPTVRARVLNLRKGATEAEMWEALAVHFDCRWAPVSLLQCVSGFEEVCRDVGGPGRPLSLQVSAARNLATHRHAGVIAGAQLWTHLSGSYRPLHTIPHLCTPAPRLPQPANLQAQVPARQRGQAEGHAVTTRPGEGCALLSAAPVFFRSQLGAGLARNLRHHHCSAPAAQPCPARPLACIQTAAQ